MTKYYEAYVGYYANETEKAICLTRIESAWGGSSDRLQWIPKSICKIGEPNKYGWRKLAVPVWFLRNNGLKRMTFREINGMDELVEY